MLAGPSSPGTAVSVPSRLLAPFVVWSAQAWKILAVTFVASARRKRTLPCEQGREQGKDYCPAFGTEASVVMLIWISSLTFGT